MSIASTFGTPMSYYGLNGPGETTACPDCGYATDVLFGDHGGDCIESVKVAIPRTALGIIHKYALTHLHFSSDDLHAEMDEKAIRPNSRGPAFGAAKTKGYIEEEGRRKSGRASAKGATVQTYRSLIFQPAQAKEAS